MSPERKYQRFVTRQEGSERSFDVALGGPSSFWMKRVESGTAGREFEVSWLSIGHGRVLLRIDGRVRLARIVQNSAQQFLIEIDGRQIPVRADDEITARALHHKAGSSDPTGPVKLLAPMPGTVVNVLIDEGEVVAKGQTVLIIEAMKMQNELVAPAAGTVRGLKVQSGQAVEARAPLCEIVP